MSSTSKLLKPPKEDLTIYSDEFLYGARREAFKLIEYAKANNNPDCVIRTSKDTVVDKRQQWNIKHLVGSDKRLKDMAEKIEASHALPVQRFCWPHIHNSPFPFVCIAPKSSGKTFTHLFYIVTQCISEVPISKTNEIIGNTEETVKKSFVCEASLPNAATIDMSNIKPDEIDFDGTVGSAPVASFSSSSSVQHEQQSLANGTDGQSNTGWSIGQVEVNPDDFIEHPKYIIVCSSQSHVETIGRQIDRMKSAAFGEKIFSDKQNKLPPKVAIIHVHQTDEKLAIKFNGCEVLIATPGALTKCIKLNLVDLTKCRRLFFDDIDLSLQLHNANIRDIVKLYIVQMHQLDEEQQQQQQQQQQNGTNNGYSDQQKTLSSCKIHMFSRKWTDLLKQSINTVFKQHVIVFGSIAEASIYSNSRYEIEYVSSDDIAIEKLRTLVERYECSRGQNDVMAVVCRTNAEAKSILSKLDNGDQNKAIVRATDNILNIRSLQGRSNKGPVYIISDSALEFAMDDLNFVTHLVHFALPEETIVYDQRFRLMYKHLASTDTVNITATVFVRPKTSNEFVKELYDVLSRSTTTLRSTKLELRDLIREKSNQICPRWASTGVCRLEKLSKDDRFGSFCPDRHSFLSTDQHPLDERWPSNGQVRLTITSMINPCEFYFWFEAHRDKNSPMKRWQTYEKTGTSFMRSLQKELDKHKNTLAKVPLESLNQQQVFGVYFPQDMRVDRVVLLEKLNFDDVDPIKQFGKDFDDLPIQFKIRRDAEYSKQVQVLKIDYGSKVRVYLRNIFALPEKLASIEAQCHRGFYLGIKPTDNEPDWLYKAKKNFYELVCVDGLQEVTVTAWMRMQNGRCFWFDNMVVSRELPEIGTRASYKTFPHEELVKKGLALACNTEPPCLPPSDRLETLCKWATDDAAKHARWAFLRKDLDHIDLYLLHVCGRKCLTLKVRQASFNKQLIALEDRLLQEYQNNQLQSLNYFDEGVFCLVRLAFDSDPTTGEPIYTINRCRIKEVIEPEITVHDADSVDANAKLGHYMYLVECLDQGDEFTVGKDSLYLAKVDHLKVLPFQSILCDLADVNPDIYEDEDLLLKIKQLLYDSTRSETGMVKTIKCRLKGQRNELYIYLPFGDQGVSCTYVPLIALFEQQDIPICTNDDPELRGFVEFETNCQEEDATNEEDDILFDTGPEFMMRVLIKDILDDIIMKELGLERNEEEDDDSEDIAQLLGSGFSDLSIH